MKTKDLSVTIIGCGWLGLPLGRALHEKQYEVRGTVRTKEGFKALEDAGIIPFQLDLEKSTEIPMEITESTSTLVITLPPIDRKNPTRYEAILDHVLKQFSDSTKVIFTSSTGIYPKDAGTYQEDFAFTKEQESTVLNRAEAVIRNAKKQHVIFRLGGLIGPNRHPIRFLQGRKGVKNPHGPINYIHQGDCLRALLETIENSDASGTFNLVYPEHPSRKNYYSDAAKHYGVKLPLFVEEDEIERLISSEKVMSSLNFKFEYPVDQFPELDLA